MATKETLSRIKQSVQACIGEKVVLKTNKGRKKVLVKEGVLEEVYSNIFVVRINNGLESERTVSYSYSDVLTETVEIKLLRNERNIYYAS